MDSEAQIAQLEEDINLVYDSLDERISFRLLLCKWL